MTKQLFLKRFSIGRAQILTGALLAILLFLLNPFISSSLVGLGGMISEKLLVRQATSSNILLLSSSTASTPIIVGGAAPRITTQSPTSLFDNTVTLNGAVVSMNGLPTSIGYFQWGYNGALTNTTAPVTITAIGDYSATIAGITASIPISYRFVCEADGTSYGGTTVFLHPSGSGGNLLRTLIPLFIACAICIGCLLKIGLNPVGLLLSGVVGIICFYIVQILIGFIH